MWTSSAVNDSRGIAPVGYHFPFDEEWTKLIDYLGGAFDAGTKMKSKTGWNKNGNGTNISGFSGLPGGFRGFKGTSAFISDTGIWWSSTENDTDSAWDRSLSCYVGSVDRDNYTKTNGYSVRCLRD